MLLKSDTDEKNIANSNSLSSHIISPRESDSDTSQDPEYISPTLLQLNPDMERISTLFLNHLVGPDVNRDEISSEQVVSDFRRILKVVSATSFRQIFCKDFLRQKYLSHCKERNFTAETQKKYLRSVIDFMNSLILEQPLEEITRDDAQQMKTLISGWIKNKSRDSKTQA